MSKYSNDPFIKTNAKNMHIKAPCSWYMLVVTCLYIGRIPFASGTFGSLTAYPIYYWATHYYCTHQDLVSFLYTISISLAIIGWYAIHLFQQETRAYDHSSIVIDELAGQLLTLAIADHWLSYLELRTSEWHRLSLTNFNFIISFIAFRYYDITKPSLIGAIDKLHRYSLAVMLDDILAAIFASATVYGCYLISLQIA